jgi:hypothetical protein
MADRHPISRRDALFVTPSRPGFPHLEHPSRISVPRLIYVPWRDRMVTRRIEQTAGRIIVPAAE